MRVASDLLSFFKYMIMQKMWYCFFILLIQDIAEESKQLLLWNDKIFFKFCTKWVILWH